MLAHRYMDKPAIVVWEMTRACRLACIHCRAEATPNLDARELDTQEARRLIDDIAASGARLLILTGGDPSRRKDLLPLIEHAANLGLRVALSPSATPDFQKLDAKTLKAAGVARVSFSLDGADAETHNAFRGVPKAWEWTHKCLDQLREAGLPFQINTTITSGNIGDINRIAETVVSVDPEGWTVFVIVPTGRADKSLLPVAEDVENLFYELWQFSRAVPFEVKTTEGQHFRRVALQHGGRTVHKHSPLANGINDGKGFVFVSHRGDVQPSGFLPLRGGNIRRRPMSEIYREAPLFQQLRNPSLLKGKCGRCEFNSVCGGSRARAFGLTGDYLAQEPLCAYQPASHD